MPCLYTNTFRARLNEKRNPFLLKIALSFIEQNSIFEFIYNFRLDWLYKLIFVIKLIDKVYLDISLFSGL